MSSVSVSEDLVPPFAVIPERITLSYAQQLQRGVRELTPVHIDDFYPEVVISYATGTRAGLDEEKTGPGMVYAAEMAHRLHDAGIQTFSGLSIPPGQDWEIILLRLAGRRTPGDERHPAKVLLVLETPALYASKACLKEVSVGMENHVFILPISCERPKPRQQEMWANVKGDARTDLMVFQAARVMQTTNGLPPRQTLMHLPDVMGDIVAEIAERTSIAPDRRSALGASRLPQVAKPSSSSSSSSS